MYFGEFGLLFWLIMFDLIYLMIGVLSYFIKSVYDWVIVCIMFINFVSWLNIWIVRRLVFVLFSNPVIVRMRCI